MRGRGYGLAAAIAVAAGAWGCDDGGAPVRGFHSRQLVSSREPTLNLLSFASKIVTEQTASGPISHYATDLDVVHYATGASPEVTYWELSLPDGRVTELGPTIPFPEPPGPPQRFDCGFQGVGGNNFTMVVHDAETRENLAVIDRVLGLGACPRYPDKYLAVVRLDEGDVGRLWTGPFDQLVRAELDLAIDAPLNANWYYENDPSKWRMTVLGGAGPAPAARGLYEIDLAQLTAAEAIAPALVDVAWAPGAAPSGAARSDGLTLADVAVVYLSDGSHQYAYRRRMDDGSDVMFVGPVSSSASRELALFPIAGETTEVFFANSGGDGSLPNIATWQQTAAPGSDTELLLTWDAANQRLISCPFASGTLPAMAIFGNDRLMGLVSPDRSRFAFALDETLRLYPNAPPGPLFGLSIAGAGSCALLADKDVKVVAIADEAVAWIESPPTGGDETLWLAGTPGDPPRAIGSMPMLDEPIFIAPATLQVQLGTDVAWLDVRDDPVKLHYVAERVFGIPTAGPRWLIVGYDLSSQDGTGTLGVVDWNTGEKREISRAVADFIVSSIHSSDRPLNIVYLVRGRTASPQDGIWTASIGAGDLPP